MTERKKADVMLLTPFDIKEKLSKFGYDIEENGFIINSKTKELTKAHDGDVINIYKDKNFAFVSGHSKLFVRDIADYVKYLSETNELHF